MMGQDYGQTQMFQSREQFRMCRLQVYNWGTFDKLHTIPIAEQGFLFVGHSGSGKTTLLDAFSALLVPPKWLNFNAAAQETERRGRDRNLATYVRGAWAEQKDGGSGEVATQYLRTGTTWSALALGYRKTDTRVVTLVQVFWMRGTASGAGDVRRHFMIFERPFDLKELDDFDLDLRRLKQTFSDAFHSGQFSAYCERFRRLLAIDNDMALRLLHKTQSAKNLGDLNTLLREFMLDRPRTFDVAETLVNEFGELNDAHQAVVTAREQVQTLTPAREEYQRLEEVLSERGGLEELRRGMDAYRDTRFMGLLEERISELRIRAEGLAGEIQRHESTVENHKHALRGLEEQHRQLGGGRIEQLEAEKQDLEAQRTERLRKRGQAQDACKKLAWALPASPREFADVAGKARRELDDWQQQANALRDRQLDLATSKRETEKEFTEVRREVEALRRQPSNIPARMVELRDTLATALGLPEDALPFAGELIAVKPEQAPWRGAIERVLHGFALSLLVEERHYAALSNHINNVHLGVRLVYFRTGPQDASTRTAQMNSLVRKLNIKECRHSAWLESELQRQFDYACVESMQAFRQTERALTREGQVRHGRSRHEKDDRHDVHDPRFWVLGFDNRDKRVLFEKQAQELADKIGPLTEEINALTQQEQKRHARAMSCQTLANMQWQEVDIAPLTERIHDIEQQLENLRHGNAELQEVGRQLEEKRGLLEKAEAALRDRRVDAQQNEKETADNLRRLDELRQTATAIELTDFQRQGLNARFDALRHPVNLDNLDKQAGLVERALNDEIKAIDVERNQLEKAVENRFADFKRRWPMEAGDVDATLASAPDFLARLKRLELDGLPAYEKRFFELLQTQSHQNLASLGTHLQQARREIRDRMELVNESLGQAEFNPGTYLCIDVSDRQLPEVREFKQEIKQALSYAFVDEREMAEQRFIVLRQLVDRLASQEADDRRWRESVLDVRQHVDFIGRELDREGREVEVYRSGAGKSGGQRQKLATTCLAAALRYQLGGSEHEVPVYAPVVIDEAFDKADNEFTTLAMNIFTNFGFQMVLATPLKSVMTLEPFIGGACYIHISDRRRSSVLLIQYDETRKRLKLPERTHGDASVAAT